jgi:CrcB protein
MNVFYVFLGGGIGATIRYLVQLLIGKHNGTDFPISTFTTNIVGCFLIGILAAFALKFKWNEQTVLFGITGVLGGYTTFSSFALEFINLVKNNQLFIAFIYLGLSNIIGLLLCGLGFYLAK